MIESLSLQQVAGIVNGQLADLPADLPPISGVSIDTRTLKPGELYIAIKGPRFDGHDYLAQAQAAGAVAALTERWVDDESLPQIVVSASEEALGLLGAANRRLFRGTLVGVTGSCGKTSVKEMLMAIFSTADKTLATSGNLNNALGTPLTLLNIDASHRFAVVEMGTSAPGEIAYIANMGRPDIAVITNAGEAHLSDLKSVAGVAWEKGFILDALPSDGTAVLNLDDPFYQHWCERTCHQQGRRTVSFSVENPQADCFATEIQSDANGTAFTLCIGEAQKRVQLALWGRYQVGNACCAAAVAMAQGQPLDIIVQGLENVRPYQRRGLRFVHATGAILIDETYNANPQSTQAAIDQLADCQGKTIMVFGDMLELGEVSDERHRDIGRYAKARGIDEFFSYGPSAHLAAQAFGSGRHFDEKSALIDCLKTRLQNNHNEAQAVLVKGSKGMKMLEIIQALIGSDYKGDA